MEEKKSASEIAMEKRLQVKINCSKPVLTDQSYKKVADINNIMKQYQRTGVLPSTREHLAQYVDNTQAVSLEVAHARIQHAQELFMQLPSDVRKLMGNDPAKMVEVISDPANKELLVKRGVLEEPKLGIQQDAGGTNSITSSNEALAE